MRVSVEVENNVLQEVMKLTGEKSKSPALVRAIEEFVRRRKAAQFGTLIREGAFDYPDRSPDEPIVNPLPPLSGR